MMKGIRIEGTRQERNLKGLGSKWDLGGRVQIETRKFQISQNDSIMHEARFLTRWEQQSRL